MAENDVEKTSFDEAIRQQTSRGACTQCGKTGCTDHPSGSHPDSATATTRTNSSALEKQRELTGADGNVELAMRLRHEIRVLINNTYGPVWKNRSASDRADELKKLQECANQFEQIVVRTGKGRKLIDEARWKIRTSQDV